MKKSTASKTALLITPRRKSLTSLLALASGAASLGVLAETAEAAIIYEPLSVTIGFGAGKTDHINLQLPGYPYIQVVATFTPANKYNRIVFGGSGAYPRRTTSFQAIRAGAGGKWSDAGVQGFFGNIFQSFSAGPNVGAVGSAFTDKYLLFKFNNAGTANYGWVGMSAGTITLGDRNGMSVTLNGWAYDNSGAMIAAGAGAGAGGAAPVPEPSTAAMFLMSALIAGGDGLRRWRKSRPGSVGAAAVPADSAPL